jgi:metal-responsive CopG/Arc/MetJ family transcriptional regulator
MKTVRLTIDEGLLKEVDAVAGSLGTTRSGFTREALRAALDRVNATAG